MPNPALRIGRALVAAMAATDGDAGAAEKVRAAVVDAGGGTLGWFRMVLEASLMDWPAKRLQPFQRELNAAQKSEPDRATVLALVGLLGQREVRGSRRAIAPAVRVFEPFLARGSQIDWSPAEFLTIGEMLGASAELPHVAPLCDARRGARAGQSHRPVLPGPGPCRGQARSASPAGRRASCSA